MREDVRALRARATARLEAAGVAAAAREALDLWAHARGVPVAAAALDTEAPDAIVQRFEAMVARREAGEPLAYVLSWWPFRHLVLAVDGRALIPRPETEQLVDLALARMRTGDAVDVGTGTGCLGLSLAREGAFASVTLTDASVHALALAQENAERCGLGVHLVCGDLTAPLEDASRDLLVANPPYLTTAEWDALAPAVQAWEPRLALDGGHDGLVPYRRLLEDGRRVLRPGGWMALEVDATRARAVAALAHAHGWDAVTVQEDLFGRERFVLARKDAA
ncbi:MAG: peptide chain release factor N(5)-glutamine methyltransferase [Gemmatimonadales bacterium]|nr:peptide chain release factor N(5)-glutamine methyltransferase [Gemmatimonadales bacterium]